MAGSKRTGAGRKRGVLNKATAARQAAVEASGLTPLDYLLGIIRDETADKGLRLEAARTVAPYVHLRLASVTVRGK
jgi:hypothetical protein